MSALVTTKEVITQQGVVIFRRPMPDDSSKLLSLRREALINHPEYFGASEAQSEEKFAEWVGNLIDPNRTDLLPIVIDAQGDLVGMGVIRILSGPKVNHSATINAIYIQPNWRGYGLLLQMLTMFDMWATFKKLHHIKLQVVTTNQSAIRSYQNAGYHIYATDPYVLFVAGKYYDEYLMIKELKY